MPRQAKPTIVCVICSPFRRCAWEAATVAIIRFSAMGAKVIRNVAIERLKAAAEQMPNKHEPVRCSHSGLWRQALTGCAEFVHPGAHQLPTSGLVVQMHRIVSSSPVSFRHMLTCLA